MCFGFVAFLSQQLRPFLSVSTAHGARLHLADKRNQHQVEAFATLCREVTVQIPTVSDNQFLRLDISGTLCPLFQVSFIQVANECVHRPVVFLQMHGVVTVELPLPWQFVGTVGRNLKLAAVVFVTQIVLAVEAQSSQDGDGALHLLQQFSIVSNGRLFHHFLTHQFSQLFGRLFDVAYHLGKIVVGVVVARQLAEFFA